MPGLMKMGELLWEPSVDRVADSNLQSYLGWLAAKEGVNLAGYDAVLTWSVANPKEFWGTIDGYFGLGFSDDGRDVFSGPIDNPTWFQGAETNYADEALRRSADLSEAIVSIGEDGTRRAISGPELQTAVRNLASELQRAGVREGDVVAAFVPNALEAVVAFLATAYVGAIWTSCAPEFGSQSVLDRFGQVKPKVLFAATEYRYRGKRRDRRSVVSEVIHGLPSLDTVFVVGPELTGETKAHNWTPRWDAEANESSSMPVSVPFDHPLWILYSSGTTGLPKPIVHGHGGILLEHLKMHVLHFDLKPADRILWYSTTGWVMWNILVSALLAGSTVVTYDGDPFWPSIDRMWEMAETEGLTFIGLSAGHYQEYQRRELQPGREHSLEALRSLGSTGSPLSPEANAWIYSAVAPDVAVLSISGGTDVATAFVGGSAFLPVHAGVLARPMLGVDAAAVDANGTPVEGEVGDLVVRQPMPSMPLQLWNDPSRLRLRRSYYEHYEGVWRHGDWIKFESDGSSVIYGRSDATLNRGGVRMGSAEFYRVIDQIGDVQDSLVVDTSTPGFRGEVVVFFVPDNGGDSEAVASRIDQAIRHQLSPRHRPDRIVPAPAIPRTLSGKRMELPVKRLLLGDKIEDTVEASSVQDAQALEFFTDCKL